VIFCSNLRIQEDFQIMSFTMNKGGTQMLISVASQVRIFNYLNLDFRFYMFGLFFKGRSSMGRQRQNFSTSFSRKHTKQLYELQFVRWRR